MTISTDRYLTECTLRVPLLARRGSTGEILRCSSFGPMMVGRNAWVLEAPLGVIGSSEAIVVSDRLFEHLFVEVPHRDDLPRAADGVIDLAALEPRRRLLRADEARD
jgi:hypothetical protein